MCGIVGAVSSRNITKILVEGLRRLEYRGYDSAGLAIVDDHKLEIRKEQGKVINLEKSLATLPTQGSTGIAHTRWATHGKPTTQNAHPHHSGTIAVVHNGIIENHEVLRKELQTNGYTFTSETDTEVIAHLVNQFVKAGDKLFDAVKNTVACLEGAYALAVIDADDPSRIIVTREGSPLVIGVGIDENFIASDQLALRQVTDRFIYLKEGDIAEITKDNIAIFNSEQLAVERQQEKIVGNEQTATRGKYRHYMLKEIYEQPKVIEQTLQGRLGKHRVLEGCFGANAKAIFDKVDHVQIIACGTSYHAGMVAKYWLESWANIACSVEVASEFRYRKVVVHKNSLIVTISQSGETADTLAALRKAQAQDYLSSLTICNVPNSALIRESELSLLTEAGTEIGVASTKAFTTQLVALQLLGIVLGRRKGLSQEQEAEMVAALKQLPSLCSEVLKLDKEIETLSEVFVDKHHALFLGRGIH
jgi:glucosamine--fructose-6-phosphate aminotransferase (isomerizing)